MAARPWFYKAAWFVWEMVWVTAALLVFASTIITVSLGVLPEGVVNWLSGTLGNVVVWVVSYIIAICVLLIPFIARRFKPRQIFKLLGVGTSFKGSIVAWAVFLFGIYIAISVFLSVIVYALNIPGVDLSQPQHNGFEGVVQWYEYVAAFVTLVVLAPIFEEMIFRGYLFGRLRSYAGFWPSALATSVLFAGVHGQVNVGIDVFALSMCMCVARERFDSIYPTVLMHMLKNGVAYGFLFIVPFLAQHSLMV